MKKLLTRALALTIASLMLAMPCMAASFTSVNYDPATGVITANLAGYTGTSEESTIIVVSNDIDTTDKLNNVSDNQILNIDQKTVTESDGTVSFELPVKDRAQLLNIKNVNVFIGGSNLDTAVKYAQSIELGIAEATTRVAYVARFNDNKTDYETVAQAKANVKVFEQTWNLNGTPDNFGDDTLAGEIDVTSSCTITSKDADTLAIMYNPLSATTEVCTIDFNLVTYSYSYYAKFASGKTVFASDAAAQRDAVVMQKVLVNGQETGTENDITNMATIEASNGVVTISVLTETINYSTTLNYSISALGISGIVNWPEMEMPMANALVYVYNANDALVAATLTDANGKYNIPLAENGTYKLVVLASYVSPEDGYIVYNLVPVVEEFTVANGAAVTKNVDVKLVYGDVNGDGIVDLDDVVEVKANYTE